MLRFLCAILTFAFLPLSANATSTASITSTNCSGNLTTSLLDGASFACAGNLTLDGGFVTSDSLINISADGDLFLDNLALTAPNVTFSNLSGMLAIGSGVVINISTAILQNSPQSIVSWSNLNTAQGDIVNFRQGSGTKTVLNKVIDLVNVPTGSVSISDGGNLSLSNSNGVINLTGSNTPVVGGKLVVGSVGSGVILTTTGSVVNNSGLTVTAVPEPNTYAMMLLGMFGLAYIQRKSI